MKRSEIHKNITYIVLILWTIVRRFNNLQPIDNVIGHRVGRDTELATSARKRAPYFTSHNSTRKYATNSP